MASPTASALRQAIRSVARADSSGVTDRELLLRFVEKYDQAAFTTLVNRHSGMLLGVCRRALPTVQDAEDACQATFLLLARKARTGRWQPSVANWLYATARKVARNALVAAQRRARREAKAGVCEAVEPIDRMSGRELLAALDTELEKLPSSYREPLVLCYLEGLTHDEAAARLAITPTTLKARIHRGRKHLHQALTKGGITLGAGLLAVVATSPAGASPPRLAQSVLAALAGKPSATVAAFVEEVAVNGLSKKSVLFTLGLVGVAALGVGLGSMSFTVVGQQPVQPPPVKANAGPTTVAKPAAAAGRTVAGRVLAPDGQPVAGAVISIPDYSKWEMGFATIDLAKTDADGKFRCVVTPPTDRPLESLPLAARADGFAGDWMKVSDIKEGQEISLRLAKATVPVRGRVLTLEGKPVAGATVVVELVHAPTETTGLKQVYERWPGERGETAYLMRNFTPAAVTGLPGRVVTDAEGRFEIKNAGDGRLLALKITGETIEHVTVRVALDAKFDPKVIKTDGAAAISPLYGPTFEHFASPTRVISGTVRDKKSGKPLAGVGVSAYPNTFNALNERFATGQTDAEGRYRLVGLANIDCHVMFGTPESWGYLSGEVPLGTTAGNTPATANIDLVKGVRVTGRVVDKETGQPIQGRVGYSPLAGNTEIGKASGLEGYSKYVAGASYHLDRDGKFRFIGPTGLGIVYVIADPGPDQPTFPQAKVPAEHREKGYIFSEGGLDWYSAHSATRQLVIGWNAYDVIDPPAGKEEVALTFQLDRGKSVTGKVEGPKGETLDGVAIAGVGGVTAPPAKLTGDRFTAIALNDDETRLLAALDVGKKLGGTVLVSPAHKETPVLTLVKWGTVTGRLVGINQKPLGGATVQIFFESRHLNSRYAALRGPALEAKTAADGKFELNMPFPGSKFNLSVSRNGQFLHDQKELVSAAEEKKDLGAIEVKAQE
jgi:RNA polymerase sigma factor (sigma-70 family)